MVTLGLLVLIAVLVVLRQSIVMIVALAVAYVHAFMTSKKNVEFLIQDVWYAIDREVLLSIPMFLLIWGVIKAGGVVVPLNVLLKPRELAYHLADSDARAILVFEGTPELPMAQAARAAADRVAALTSSAATRTPP